MKSRSIPKKTFQLIKNNIPFSCVDLILVNEKNEFLLVKRKIEPYKNKWCLPGGIVKKGQKLENKLQEVAKKELGVKANDIRPLGFYEKIYSKRHDISHCYVCKTKHNAITLDFQASSARFFKQIPSNTANFHVIMLNDAGFQ